MADMPYHPCEAGHDWSDVYNERLKGANGVTIVRRMKSCLGCQKTQEVFDQPYETVRAGRIKTYE